MRGFHPESQCMKKTIDQISTLLQHNNIALPQRVKKSDAGQPTEDHERCHALKAGLSLSKAYLIDFGASNHMVSSKESFTTLNLSGGPSIHMADDSQIPTIGRGYIKIHHGEFRNVLYVPSVAANLLSAY